MVKSSKESKTSLSKARQLRRKMTVAERKLWSFLCANQLGAHFRRQAPVGPYIVDFFSRRAKLVVELDGSQHSQEEKLKYDTTRQTYLENRGYRVLRFNNVEFLRNQKTVVQSIYECVKKKLPGCGKIN